MSKEIVELFNYRIADAGNSVLKEREDSLLAMYTAHAIYNQKLCNSRAEFPAFFKQINCLAIAHIMRALPHEIISLQTLQKETDSIFYLEKAGQVESMATSVVKPLVHPSMIINDPKVKIPKEEFAYHCSEMAITVTEDIVYKILADLISIASSKLHANISTAQTIVEAISAASNAVKDKIGKSANFVVLPIGLARSIKSYISAEYDFEALPINVKRIGYLQNKMVLFISGHHETNKILVGYRGTHHVDAGYIYSPHVLFTAPLKEGENKINIRSSSFNRVMPDYFACVELTLPRMTPEILEF